MVEIRPFRGYTYNLKKVEGISSVIAPPWDVVDADGEKSLRALSDRNVINLISSGADPSHVRDTFEKWIADEVLVRDEKESFYFGSHRFEWMGKAFERKGVFALLRLQDFSSENVIPHEKVFEKYHTNRYKLIEKCRANFSPIFMLYRDKSRAIDGIIDGASVSVEGSMGGGDEIGFGRIAGGDEIKQIKDLLSSGKLIIADGHHRYQGALQYYKDNPGAENAFVMVFLVNVESPELLILPTHRYIRSGVSFLDNMTSFEKYFGVEKIPSLDAMAFAMRQDDKAKIFGVYEKGEFFALRLKDPEKIKKYMPEGLSMQWRMLDTVILHNFIFARMLNAENPELFFHQSPEYLMNEYRRTNSGVIFFLNPVSKKQFADICFSGELMPQKTTYFYPKVPTGLVINKF